MSGIKMVRSKKSFVSGKSQGFCLENGKIDILDRKTNGTKKIVRDD